ncbi:MAG TPA: magnesium transporter [Deinococcales bacterium]|nr:magnesium transporter [Deinococcales bacterium]
MILPTEAVFTTDQLLEVLRAGELGEFKRLLRALPEAVVDRAFEDALRDERVEFLRLMPVERAATTFTDLRIAEQVDLVTDLPSDRLRLMGAFMGPDEVADLLGHLENEPECLQHVTRSLHPSLVEKARDLMRYEEDEAGGLMTPDLVALREGASVQQALAFLRQNAETAETISHLYLVDPQNRLTGVLPLRSLLVSRPEASVSDLARRDVISARTDTDQEEVVRLMRDYDLTALPVVDENGVLKGIVTIDDVLDVAEEEASEDMYKSMAIQGTDLDYLHATPGTLWRRRVLWLAALSISEFLTANVIKGYEGELAAQTALAAFIPALIGTGGNTGSQSAILVVRAIATGQLRGRDAWRVLLKELGTGLLLGVSLAAFAYVRVALIFGKANVALAVAIAMFAIIVVANIVGGLLPIAFSKLKIDPAVTSSPFLATLMDATGLIIYFNVARLVLKL